MKKGIYITILLMLIYFLGLLSLLTGLFDLQGLVMTLILVILGYIVLFGILKNTKSGWGSAVVFFIAGFFNTLYLSYLTSGWVFTVLYIAVVLGFLIAGRALIVLLYTEEEEVFDKSIIIDNQFKEKMPELFTAVKATKKSEAKKSTIKKSRNIKSENVKAKGVKSKFSPGRYVASSTGSVYHVPKCGWAKKIKPKKRVWLKDKNDAKKKGY
ncbi:hypothetical protein ACFL1H_05190, partial [Nanoarchaeota archaeon]